MRCARCNRRVKQNPVYFKGQLYGEGCASKRGYREPIKIADGDCKYLQIDLFSKLSAFDNWSTGLEW